jgi:ketosteroid isomerase-like protein
MCGSHAFNIIRTESGEEQMRLTTTAALASFLGLMAFSQQKTGQGAEAPSGSPVRSIVESKIREAWLDFKEKKADAYAALLDDDFTAVEIDGQGPHDKNASVREVTAGTLNSYSLNDLKVIALGANSALATYTANTDGTMPDGKIVHGTVAVTEVWVRRAGNWKNLRYHESELK